MAKRVKRRATRAAATSTSGSSSTINAWEDDPEPAVLVVRPVPNVAKRPLAFAFPTPKPPAGMYQPGTPQFRLLAAAEALRRGADFWAACCRRTQWHVGTGAPGPLDAGKDLNAYYDRRALNFFHGTVEGRTFYSGESPDVVCHEMGHAILDALSRSCGTRRATKRPPSTIRSATSARSCRRCSCHRCANRSLATRTAISTATRACRGSPSSSARRSARSTRRGRPRLPAQRGELALLPRSDHPAGRGAGHARSSEPHSFSRVFTGGFFEALGGMLANGRQPVRRPSRSCSTLSGDLADMLVTATKNAPVVPDWVFAGGRRDGPAAAGVNETYPAILKAVFVRRSILSLKSASKVRASAPTIARDGEGVGGEARPAARPPGLAVGPLWPRQASARRDVIAGPHVPGDRRRTLCHRDRADQLVEQCEGLPGRSVHRGRVDYADSAGRDSHRSWREAPHPPVGQWGRRHSSRASPVRLRPVPTLKKGRAAITLGTGLAHVPAKWTPVRR